MEVRKKGKKEGRSRGREGKGEAGSQAGLAWWHMPLILALGKQRQADLPCEFQASLIYIKQNSRTTRAKRNLVSKLDEWIKL